MADQPAETVPILEEVEVESTIFVLSFLPLDLAFAIIQGRLASYSVHATH